MGSEPLAPKIQTPSQLFHAVIGIFEKVNGPDPQHKISHNTLHWLFGRKRQVPVRVCRENWTGLVDLPPLGKIPT
jgi:hypothetical protein